MATLSVLHKHRLRLGLLAALLATLVAGLFAVARGQAQLPTNCQVVGRVRVCADRIENGGVLFSARGRLITLGRDDQPQTVRVLAPTRDALAEQDASLVIDLTNTRREGLLVGDVSLLGDFQGKPMVRTKGAKALRGADSFLRVDLEEARITNFPEKQFSEAIRNQGLSFDFLKSSAMQRVFIFASDLELADVEVNFELRTGRFDAAVPLSDQRLLFLRDDVFPKNAELDIGVSLDNKADGEITIQAFRAEFFGMIGEFKGTKIIRSPLGNNPGLRGADPAAEEDKPVNLDIESVSFFRADNPGLPNLDAAKPELVFSLQGIQYADGRFKLRGGSVGIPDWSAGSAFKLTNQQAGIVENTQTKTAQLVISSTLTFPAGSIGSDARAFPLSIRVTGRELPNGGSTAAITGTLVTAARPALSFGPLSISTPAKTELVFDPTQNFFGLKADQVSLRWNAALGGGSGVQTGFKLGVDKDKKLVFGLGAGGAIALPQVRNKAFTMQLSAGVASANDTTTFLITGKAQLALPGNGSVAPGVTMFIRGGKNVRDVCTPAIAGCLKRFEYSLSSFELSLGGFGVGLTNAKGTDDGGFAVEKASLKVPVGIKSIAGSISGFKVTGNGDVSITGGSVELPPMQVGSFSLVGVKGAFVKNATGYEFKGVGTVPLPGLDPSGGPAGKRISGEVVIRTRFDASFAGFGVSVQFDTGSPGIPIASTGMELTMLRGGFDVNSGTLKITVGMRASSQIRFGPVPAATADGTASVQLNPFQLTANAKLSVLVIDVAQASVGIGHQQGFAGGPGFNVAFDINFILARGETRLRIGPLTLANGVRKTVIAAEASYTVGIKRSAIFTLMPPVDINVASLAFKGGTFTVKGRSETLGLLGQVKINNPIPFMDDFKLSVFVNLQSKKVDVTDTDDYKLIDAVALRANAAKGLPGFSSRTFSADETRALNLSADAKALAETLPVVIDRKGTALFGISYAPGSTPSLSLRLPDGSLLNEGNAAAHRVAFLRYTDSVTEPHELAFVLPQAQPGSYSLLIDGAPASYETVSYMLNAEPVVSGAAVTCGGPAIAGVTLSCGGSEATVSWAMQDADSGDATVQVGYAPLGADGNADLFQLTTLAEGLPAGQGSFTWSVGDVASGSYHLVVRAVDGQHAPVDVAASTTITVDDKRAPAAPGGLAAEALPGELLVTWAPGAERDLAGYEIGFGIVQAGAADSSDAFIYSRDMGAKEVAITTTGVLDARLWGLEDDQEVFVGIRAYDQSGNTGAWSSLLRAKPWALAPDAWTPVPSGTLPMAGAVEVAFASPLRIDAATVPAGLLEVRAADGTLVAGRLEAITNLDGDAVVGLRFVPAAALRGGERYTVVLKGGAGGVAASDGRQMAQDYRWAFTAEMQQLFLPVVGR